MVFPTAAAFYFYMYAVCTRMKTKRKKQTSPEPSLQPSPEPSDLQNPLNLTWPAKKKQNLLRKLLQTFSGTFSGTLLNLTWLCTKVSQTFSGTFGTFSGTSLNLTRRLQQCTPKLFWAEDSISLRCWGISYSGIHALIVRDLLMHVLIKCTQNPISSPVTVSVVSPILIVLTCTHHVMHKQEYNTSPIFIAYQQRGNKRWGAIKPKIYLNSNLISTSQFVADIISLWVLFPPDLMVITSDGITIHWTIGVVSPNFHGYNFISYELKVITLIYIYIHI